jgi:type IV pilus assembly protein PilV
MTMQAHHSYSLEPSLPQSMRGVGLVEALVALVILLIGLLGLASLTINSIRFSDDAHLRSSAVSMAYDIADRIRANPAARTRYITAFADQPAATTNCTLTTCDENELASWDLAQWKQALATALPSGQGQIQQSTTSSQMTITVQWENRETTGQYQLLVTFHP